MSPVNVVPSPKSQNMESICVPGGVVTDGLKVVVPFKQTLLKVNVAVGPGITDINWEIEFSQSTGAIAVKVTV